MLRRNSKYKFIGEADGFRFVVVHLEFPNRYVLNQCVKVWTDGGDVISIKCGRNVTDEDANKMVIKENIEGFQPTLDEELKVSDRLDLKCKKGRIELI